MFNNKSPFLLTTIRNMFKESPKPLGRWAIDKSPKSSYILNYYSNIDHCGDCLYEKKVIEQIVDTKEKVIN